MWTEITRPKYERHGLRYASDLTDGEWDLISPYLPAPKALGRPRTTDLREAVNGLLYLLHGGRPWCWVVERTIAWLNRNRRLAKNFEATLASAEAWLYIGSVQLLARRLARA